MIRIAIALLYAALLSGLPPPIRALKTQASYDCAEVEPISTEVYRDWEKWNVVAFLEWMRERTGVEVAIVHWPLKRAPSGRCYDSRFMKQDVRDFERWIHSETRARNIPLLDLHESVPNQLFFDSLHLNQDGHRRIAPAIRRFVTSVMESSSQEARHE